VRCWPDFGCVGPHHHPRPLSHRPHPPTSRSSSRPPTGRGEAGYRHRASHPTVLSWSAETAERAERAESVEPRVQVWWEVGIRRPRIGQQRCSCGGLLGEWVGWWGSALGSWFRVLPHRKAAGDWLGAPCDCWSQPSLYIEPWSILVAMALYVRGGDAKQLTGCSGQCRQCRHFKPRCLRRGFVTIWPGTRQGSRRSRRGLSTWLRRPMGRHFFYTARLGIGPL